MANNNNLVVAVIDSLVAGIQAQSRITELLLSLQQQNLVDIPADKLLELTRQTNSLHKQWEALGAAKE